MVGAEWDQGQVPGALDGSRQGALVLRADTGLPAGLDLPAVGHISAESVGVLVVDELDVIYAKAADLSTAVVSGPAAPAAESSAAATARPSTATRPSAATARPSA